jgi:hypothetical protein
MYVTLRYLLSPARVLACSHSYRSSLSLFFLAAGDLKFTDPETGQIIVYNLGDIAWVLASTALVWIMVPGVGFFYSGLLRRKNALSMISLSMITLAVVSFQVWSLYHTPFHLLNPDAYPASGSFGAFL